MGRIPDHGALSGWASAFLLGYHKFKSHLNAPRGSAEIVEGLKTFQKVNMSVKAPEFLFQAFEKVSELPAARGSNMTLLLVGRRPSMQHCCKLCG